MPYEIQFYPCERQEKGWLIPRPLGHLLYSFSMTINEDVEKNAGDDGKSTEVV